MFKKIHVFFKNEDDGSKVTKEEKNSKNIDNLITQVKCLSCIKNMFTLWLPNQCYVLLIPKPN